MSTATILYRFRALGEVAVARLDPPLDEGEWGNGKAHEFVAVSAVDLMTFGIFPRESTCETYIFPADPEAVAAQVKSLGALVSSWGELPGSIKDTKDHYAALREAGYDEIIEAGA